MKIFTCLIICLSGILVAPAQLTGIGGEQNYRDLIAAYGPTRSSSLQVFDNRNRNVKGSPLLFEGWQDGILTTQDGKVYTGIPLNYDLVEELVVVKTEKGYPILLKKGTVESFSLTQENKNRVFRKFSDPGNKAPEASPVFMEVLVEGKVLLLCLREKYFIPADTENAAYNNQLRPEYRETKPAYFLDLKDGQGLIKARRTNGKLVKQLGATHTGLKAWAKSQGLLAQYDDELVKIIDHYNDLQP